MEAVTGQRVASPGLHHLTLGVFTTVDTWSSAPAIDAVTQLLEAAGDQGEMIPHSIGAVLPLLVGDGARLRVALDAIQRLDLYEAAAGLDSLAWRGLGAAVSATSDVEQPGRHGPLGWVDVNDQDDRFPATCTEQPTFRPTPFAVMEEAQRARGARALRIKYRLHTGVASRSAGDDSCRLRVGICRVACGIAPVVGREGNAPNA